MDGSHVPADDEGLIPVSSRGTAADAFFWLGDAVYLDKPAPGNVFIREPMGLASMRADFTRQLYRGQYCLARRSTAIFGTWDDHDMGVNDGNASYMYKRETQQMFLDFLDLPDARELGFARQWPTLVRAVSAGSAGLGDVDDEGQHALPLSREQLAGLPAMPPLPAVASASPSVFARAPASALDEAMRALLAKQWAARRARDGVYNSVLLGPPGRRVKVLLLDVRTSQLKVKNGTGVFRREDESMLGADQWRWAEREILSAAAPRGSPEYREHGAELLVAVSGIEAISWGKPITEGWRSFEHDRARLLALIAEATVRSHRDAAAAEPRRRPLAALVVSGDVHFSEFQRTFVVHNDTFAPDPDARAVHPSAAAVTAGAGLAATPGMLGTLAQLGRLVDTLAGAAPAPLPAAAPGSGFVTPVVELTTSGVTHGWGEMAGQRTLAGSIARSLFPLLLRAHVTGLDLGAAHGDLLHEYLVDALAKDPQSQAALARVWARVQSQGWQWFYHNYAAAHVDWDADVLRLTIRDRLGAVALDFPFPMAFLRAHDVHALARAAEAGLTEIPAAEAVPGTLTRWRSRAAAHAYFSAALAQAREELSTRLLPAGELDIVQGFRGLWLEHRRQIQAAWVFAWLAAVLALRMLLGWSVGSAVAALCCLRCCSPRGRFCCGACKRVDGTSAEYLPLPTADADTLAAAGKAAPEVARRRSARTSS
jgi:hypothetical protein